MNKESPTQTSAAEMDAIVRAVMDRLRSLATPDPSSSQSGPSTRAHGSAPGAAEDAASADALRLDDRLITLERLRTGLVGIRRLQIPARAVVTPAAVDELRRRQISLERVGASGQSGVRAGLIVAPAQWLPTVVGELAGTVRGVAQRGMAADWTEIESQLRVGEGRGFWITATPYAAMAVTRTVRLARAVQLNCLQELEQAIDEARPNVLILDQRHWSAADAALALRQWMRSSA